MSWLEPSCFSRQPHVSRSWRDNFKHDRLQVLTRYTVSQLWHGNLVHEIYPSSQVLNKIQRSFPRPSHGFRKPTEVWGSALMKNVIFITHSNLERTKNKSKTLTNTNPTTTGVSKCYSSNNWVRGHKPPILVIQSLYMLQEDIMNEIDFLSFFGSQSLDIFEAAI